MSNLDEKLRHVIAATFHVPISAVDSSASSLTIPAWDSVGQAELILAIEQEFGVTLSPEDMLQMDSYAAIFRFLNGQQRVS